MDIKVYSPAEQPSADETDQLTSFLFKHLEQYGDPQADIQKAVDYALQKRSSPGGDILVGYEGDAIAGAVVLNKTGMDGYIPENILVYIAVSGDYRGQGLGKQLMAKAIEVVEGGIALHVEPDNPAVHLYKKMGFTNKYLEMRYTGN
jgi:ribosomal-protein-alanine N-acetyltransferase